MASALRRARMTVVDAAKRQNRAPRGRGDQVSITLEVDEDEPTPGLLPDGRPDPAYASALGLVPAPLSRRAIAFVIDLAIVVVMAIPVIIALVSIAGQLNDSTSPTELFGQSGIVFNLVLLALGELLINVAIIVQLILHGRKGFTVGKALVGIRSVNVARFDRPGFWWMVLRGLVFQFSVVVVPLLGAVVMVASPLWDPQKRGRGWLDAVGQNWLIDITHGLNPYDAKALRHARRRLEEPDKAPDVGLPSLATGAQSGTPGERSPLFAPGSRSHSAIVGGVQLAGQPPAPQASQPPGQQVPAQLPTQPAGQPSSAQLTSQPPAPARIAPAPPVPMPAPAAASTAAAAPPTPPAQPAPSTIVFDTGIRFEVSRDGLIGRNPEPRAGESGLELLSVPDDTLSVSKTHAAFGIDAQGFWVSDRDSRNGVAIRSVDGESTIVSAGERSYVRAGDTVFIGQRSFVVHPA
jgi:uncharacterized RDD family membrane protein YckC